MNLLIVDDEPAARVGLIRLCERAPDMHVVGEAVTGAQAIEAAESLRPDLMLLDADLPDMSGFDVLRALRRRHKRRSILITDNEQEASGAFAAGALDFLMKPVNEAAFCASILRARARNMPLPVEARRLPTAVTAAPGDGGLGRPLFLVGEREHRLYPLDPYQIDFVQAAGNYVTYHLAGVEYIARESIKRLDPVLAPAGFLRIERSLLLNIRSIAFAEPIGDGCFVFTLTKGARLHSGRTFRDTILEALPLRRRAPALLPASR
jgi:two-component system LytT family response regulator